MFLKDVSYDYVRLYLFDQKYSKNTNVLKCFLQFFFLIKLIPVMAKLNFHYSSLHMGYVYQKLRKSKLIVALLVAMGLRTYDTFGKRCHTLSEVILIYWFPA